MEWICHKSSRVYFPLTPHLRAGCHRLCHSGHSESYAGLNFLIEVISVIAVHISLAIANFVVLASYGSEEAVCQVSRVKNHNCESLNSQKEARGVSVHRSFPMYFFKMKKESWDTAQWENTCLAYPGCWGQYPVSRRGGAGGRGGGAGGRGVIVGKFVFGICPLAFLFFFFFLLWYLHVFMFVCACVHIYVNARIG